MLIGKDPPTPHRSHARGGPLQAGRHVEGILSVEIWADRASLDAHMGHDHTQQFLRVGSALVSGEPAMSFYEVPGVG